eukprot:6306442-Prymnesium_polylepis.1
MPTPLGAPRALRRRPSVAAGAGAAAPRRASTAAALHPGARRVPCREIPAHTRRCRRPRRRAARAALAAALAMAPLSSAWRPAVPTLSRAPAGER